MKKWIHAPYYNDVEVTCICGANFKINATVPGPIKVETCRYCHPAFNENKEVKKVIKGRMEKFLEKQEAICLIVYGIPSLLSEKWSEGMPWLWITHFLSRQNNYPCSDIIY